MQGFLLSVNVVLWFEEESAADTLWIRLVDAGVKETVIRRLEALGLAVIDNESSRERGEMVVVKKEKFYSISFLISILFFVVACYFCYRKGAL